jgi:hypothetical protein
MPPVGEPMSDLYQALLGMMTGGQQGLDRQQLLTQLLTEQGVDPTTQQLLSQAFAQSSRGEEADDTEDLDDDRLATRRRRAVRRLRRHLQAVEAELDELRERNDCLAAALGACYECWGEDPDCDICGGDGRPGSSLPDRRLFKEIVDPAIRAVQAERQRRRARESDRRSKGGTV